MAPHGVRGHVKVKSFTEDPVSLFAFPEIYDGQKQHVFRFEKDPVPQDKGLFVARLKDVLSRTAAEALRGQKLFVERTQLPMLSDADTFYHTDLLGLRVLDQEDQYLGEIQEVPNFGAGDLLHVGGQGKSLWIPFTQACVPEIHLQEGFVRVNREQMV